MKIASFFSNEKSRNNLLNHCTSCDKPVRIRQYRRKPRQTEVPVNEIKRMLYLNIIEKGKSVHTSNVILLEAPVEIRAPVMITVR